jgi:fatty acid desaturase
MSDPISDQDFPGAEARRLVRDLFVHSARLYWTDLVLTLLIAYGGVALYLTSPAFSLAFCAGFTVAAFALFRCGVFIHEIVHMPRGRLKVFRVAWNILFGIPTLMPSFMYKNHADHHNPRLFGTATDGEYLPLGAGPVRRIVFYVLQIPLLPALAIVRFLILAPLTYVHPRLRRWVWERASAFVINPAYRRALTDDEPRRAWRALEAAIFVELAVFAGLLFSGKVAWSVFGELYVLGIAAAGLNWIRTVAAHGYLNTGAAMSFRAQVEDSHTVTSRSPMTVLLFPVGLRYHSLHHMFPALPYHALGTAHRRLMAQLPADSPYRATMRRGLLEAAADLWRSAGAANRPSDGRDRTQRPSARSRVPLP